jgi:hypothetical protein
MHQIRCREAIFTIARESNGGIDSDFPEKV